MEKRVVLHLDLDYFFAQVEERKNPAIAGKPIVVCIFTDQKAWKGAVSTANYVARRYGVRSGMPVSQAKRLLENTDAVFLPANHELYEEVSFGIRTILASYAAKLEQASIDEFYLELSKDAGMEEAKEIAIRIKNAILEKFKLTCSIGIGPNKLIAKIAAGMQKPDGLTIVEPDKVQEFLDNLEVEKIPGIGKKTSEYLRAKGIATIRQLRLANFAELAEEIGKNAAGALREAALGIDRSEVKEEQQKQVSRMTTLKEVAESAAELLDALKELSSEVAQQLQMSNMMCKAIGVILIDDKMAAYSRSVTISFPTNDGSVIEREAYELCKEFFSENKKRIRRIGVRAEKLENVSGQKTLGNF